MIELVFIGVSSILFSLLKSSIIFFFIIFIEKQFILIIYTKFIKSKKEDGVEDGCGMRSVVSRVRVSIYELKNQTFGGSFF